MKSLSDIIKDALLQNGHRSVRIDDTSLFFDLIKPDDEPSIRHPRPEPSSSSPKWRLFRFIALTLWVLACTVFVIYTFTFFIKDIILFNSPPVVSHAGAIIPQRSCSREQVLFLFNSADCWASTGVHLREGDRIRISYSGGFHSDIVDVYTRAVANDTLMYPYYAAYDRKAAERHDHQYRGAESRNIPNVSLGRRRSTGGIDNCLYRRVNKGDQRWFRDLLVYDWECDRTPYFGSILWQVNSENTLDDNRFDNSDRIHQIAPVDAERFIKIKDDGELFLSVNDIYITDSVALTFNRNRAEILKNAGLMDSLRNSPALARGLDLGFIGEKQDDVPHLSFDSLEIRRKVREREDMRDIWFRDNVGNVLICVEIERKIDNSLMHWFAPWYRQAERLIGDTCSAHSHWLVRYICVFAVAVVCVAELWLCAFALTLLVAGFLELGYWLNFVDDKTRIWPTVRNLFVRLWRWMCGTR